MRRDDDPVDSEGSGPGDDLTAITESDLEALKMERSLDPTESAELRARRLFRENLDTAVMGIIKTAAHATNERLRFDAQKYVVERILGRVGDDPFVDDPVSELLKDVITYVEDHA